MSAQPYKPRYSRLPSDTIVTMTMGNLREFACGRFEKSKRAYDPRK